MIVWANTKAGRRRQRVLMLYGPICYICQKDLQPDEITIDHFIPKAKGGTNSLENLRVACYDCNHNKADLLPEEHMARVKKVK